MMPRTLTLIRHGESESNLVKRRGERGKPHPQEAELMKVHTSERRLTDKGVKQAQAAGKWLKNHFVDRGVREMTRSTAEGRPFQGLQRRFYVSPYARAMETAGHMAIPEIRWRVDPRLCERNWGKLDHMPYDERIKQFGEHLAHRERRALYWRPADGETMQEVSFRVRDWFDTLHRECSDMDVIVVCHGETMWVVRSELEYWLPRQLADKMLSTDTDWRNKLINCRVVQYTRERIDGSLAKRICRVRLVNPGDSHDPKTNLDWQPVSRREFSSGDLLEYVDQFPRILMDVA